MTPFELIQLKLGSDYYLLLPKLVPKQVEILRTRLSTTGNAPKRGEPTAGKHGGSSIRIDESGYCRSSRDPLDVVAPIIPDLLAVPKVMVDGPRLSRMYVHQSRSRGRILVRFISRIERGRLWKGLRTSGLCGLSPDEHHVLKALLSASPGKCSMLTDFPEKKSWVRLFGRKQYYETPISTSEAAETLCVAGKRKERNCYIPEDGLIVLNSATTEASEEWSRALEDLGEWCFWERRPQKL